MSLFSICFNYINIIMLTFTPLLFIIYLFIYLFIIIIIIAKQTNQVSLMIVGFPFSLSKGATTSFKPIYKCF